MNKYNQNKTKQKTNFGYARTCVMRPPIVTGKQIGRASCRERV